MERVSFSSTRRGAAAVVLALALTGCGTAKSTPVIVYVTPTPTATATVEETPTEAATSTPTAAATSTPTPATTATSSPTPAASPTSAAAACTGSAANKAFFLDAASKLTFDVYCAKLPSTWWLETASYVLPDGGYLEAHYKNAGGAELGLREGRWCPPGYFCSAPGATIGPASFDGLAGTLYLNNTTYTLQVGTYANPEYLMVGHGMTQAQFVAWAAAMVKVPKG